MPSLPPPVQCVLGHMSGGLNILLLGHMQTHCKAVVCIVHMTSGEMGKTVPVV